MKFKSIMKFIGSVLMSKTDECGLFPIVARIGLYGLLLLTIEYFQAERFDANELITVVSFLSIVTIVEMMWRKSNAGRRLIWHFGALVILIGLLGVLLNQAIVVREAWYRTNVLELRIQDLISNAPGGIVVADGNDKIKFINDSVTDLIGWTNAELKDKSITILMRPQKVEAHQKAFFKEVNEVKQGSVKWLFTGNRIFRMVAKDKTIVKVRIFMFAIRFSADTERGKYPLGQDVEIYAIIQPVEPLIDPEEAYDKAIQNIEQSKKEEIKDRQK